MTKKLRYLLIIIFLIVIGFLGIKSRVLVVEEAATGEVIHQQQIHKELKFAIQYIHSVERTPVWDYFKTKEDQIVLKATKYESYGAGLPFLNQNDYIVKNDKFIIDNINTNLREIPVRISDYAKHKLLINNQVYKLYKLTATQNLVLIKIEDKNLYQLLLWEVRSWLTRKN